MNVHSAFERTRVVYSSGKGLLFDALFWIAWALVHGTAAAAGVWVAAAAWGAHPAQQAGALVLGYLVFLHAFVLVAGGLRRALQPRLVEGATPIGLNRMYVAWGVQSVFQGVFTTSFVARQVHILFYLRWLYYRLMGMRLSLSTLIGTQAVIRQAELIELGERVIVGEDSLLVPHLSPDGRTHVQRGIRVGARSVVGGRASLGPGTRVGEDSVVGAHSLLTVDCSIGDRVRIGPAVVLLPGVSVGDGARVLAGAVVREKTSIPPGETWGGNPAAPVR
jgi:acetyltransferase-like isoleucine patch superfamily enzyme